MTHKTVVIAVLLTGLVGCTGRAGFDSAPGRGDEGITGGDGLSVGDGTGGGDDTFGGDSLIGGDSAAALDDLPDPFDFADQTGAIPGTPTVSDIVQITGIEGSVSISVSGATGATPWNLASVVAPRGNLLVTEDVEGLPHSVAFNDDGSRLYVLGWTSDAVHQYDLLAPYDVTSGTYDTAFSVAAVDDKPTSLAFNDTGSRMYVVGKATATIYQYTLATPFDVATASYDLVSHSLASQDTSPYSVTFNGDGTKMYMLGSTTGGVYQYGLLTPYDLTTVSYDSVSYLFAAPTDSFSRSLAFNADGTELFILTRIHRAIYKYTLASPYDIATASYASERCGLSLHFGLPTTFTFHPDGSTVFVAGEDGHGVRALSLATPFDLNTLVNDPDSYSVAPEARSPESLAISSDGSRMYALCRFYQRVFQYTLAVPHDVATATYDHVFLDIIEDNNPHSVSLNPAGTRIYVSGYQSSKVHQYDLTIPFEIATATYGGATAKFTVAFGEPESHAFSVDGSKLYVLTYNDGIYQYSLASPWDVSTESYDSVFLALSEGGRSIRFDDSGDLLFVVTARGVARYVLAIAFDVSSATFDRTTFAPAPELGGAFSSISFGNGGSPLHALSVTRAAVHTYDLTAPFDSTTARNLPNRYALRLELAETRGIRFNADGTQLDLVAWGVGHTGVHRYNLAAPYDLSTRSYDPVFLDTATETDRPVCLAWKDDGTRLFVLANGTPTVFQYSLTTPFDLGTATYDSVSLDVGVLGDFPLSMELSDDGARLYAIGTITELVHLYSLATPYDLSTAAYDGIGYPVGVEGGSRPLYFFFARNGSNMYVASATPTNIYQYSLATPYDPSTANYDGVFFAGSARGLQFSDTGTTMFRQDTYGFIEVLPLSGSATPEFRICADPACNTVLHPWTSGTATISEGQYIQLRATNDSAPDTPVVVDVVVGSGTADWQTTTAPI